MFVMDKNQLTSAIDLLLLNLAVADAGMCGVCFPFVVSSSFAQRWLYGNMGCTIYGYLGFLFGNTATCTLSAISVQRYLVVVWRHSNNQNATTVMIIVATWLQAAIWSSLPLLLPKPYDLEPFGTSCSVSWASPEPNTRLFINTMVAWFGMHFVILTFCYVGIFIAMKRGSIRARTASTRDTRNRIVSKVCFLLVVTFVVCWSPYTIFSLWLPTARVNVPTFLTALPVMLAKVSACVNPLLYIVVSQRFRQKYIQLITCRFPTAADASRNCTISMTQIRVACNEPDTQPPRRCAEENASAIFY